MTRLVTQATAIALLLFTVGLISGCGGGSMDPGGLCIFSPQKLPA